MVIVVTFWDKVVIALTCRNELIASYNVIPLIRYVATCMVTVAKKVKQAGGALLGSKHQGHNVNRNIDTSVGECLLSSSCCHNVNINHVSKK